ncbi:hypothetical protein D1816_16100 [Aquimarina sp. AD10]|uniref:hypothetical protein n=1 Tax=Aquimarina sp. AD10 TaxID=1714849 RepID=UPI000E4DC045|nr:hypothetical protein [Aquimarina sp. AD10]AXT61812.1 hypothetical protein D1816_16100 [Aquimarina sp. AD10]RKN02610.1 hypothetical protein D7033_00225 [Aquimarina sp. AD10]
MRKIMISTMMIVFMQHINAQDLIITSQNDSINAKITKIKEGKVNFRYMKNGNLKKTLLPLSEIEVYEKNFYKTSGIPSKAKLESNYKGKRLHVGTNAGFAFRTAKISGIQDETLKKHVKKLKSGVNFGLDAHYFLKERLGLGLKFNSFYSTAKENNLVASFPNGDVGRGLENKVSINFIGPSLMTRLLSKNKKHTLLLSTAAGYISYKDEQTIGNRLSKTTGDTIGVSVDLGYDIGLTDYMALEFLTSWTTGALDELEVEENGAVTTIDLVDTTGDREGLSRINISAGLRFYL